MKSCEYYMKHLKLIRHPDEGGHFAVGTRHNHCPMFSTVRESWLTESYKQSGRDKMSLLIVR